MLAAACEPRVQSAFPFLSLREAERWRLWSNDRDLIEHSAQSGTVANDVFKPVIRADF
jgi:hypothetical protein